MVERLGVSMSLQRTISGCGPAERSRAQALELLAVWGDHRGADIHRVGVRDHTAKLRAYPLHQHDVVNRPATPEVRHGTRSSE